MRAVVARGAGGVDVLALADVPEPVPGPDEVLVRVRLAGVNFADVNARRGTYGGAGGLRGLGLEVLGEVAAVGAAVRGLTPGLRVAGFSRGPGYAELAVAHQDLVWPVPDEVPDEQAAAFPVVGCTALHLLRSAARLQPGERVLITAAAGGVGSTAVQLARLCGAGLVVGAAGSADRAKAAVAAGADAGIDYSAGPLAGELAAAVGPGGVDVVLDGVGGRVRTQALDCLGPFGRLVHFGNSSGTREELPTAREQRERNLAVVGFHLAALRAQHRELVAAAATVVLDRLREGSLRIAVGDVLPLAEAAEAHRRLESRRVSGKLLLAVDR
jgi:NADPH:quinone reductase